MGELTTELFLTLISLSKLAQLHQVQFGSQSGHSHWQSKVLASRSNFSLAVAHKHRHQLLREPGLELGGGPRRFWNQQALKNARKLDEKVGLVGLA